LDYRRNESGKSMGKRRYLSCVKRKFRITSWLSLKVFCHTYTRVCHYFIVEPPAGARGFQVVILNSSFENNY